MSYARIVRRLLLATLLTLAACGAPETEPQSTCPQPAAQVELTATEVNLFTWPEYVPDEIIDCFETVYGIEVNLDLFSSPEEMYAKISRGATGYDLIQPPDYMVQLLINQGLLAPLDHARLPVLAHFAPQHLNPSFDPGNQYTLPYQSGSSGIAYRTDQVTAPTAYADLWNAAYAGRLVMLDDARNIIGATLLTLGYEVNTTDPAQLAAAKTKLLALVPNVRLFDSDSPKTALIAGDADLGVMWSGEAFLAQAENAAIDYVYPSEGVILFQDNFALLTDAPPSRRRLCLAQLSLPARCLLAGHARLSLHQSQRRLDCLGQGAPTGNLRHLHRLADHQHSGRCGAKWPLAHGSGGRYPAL